MYPHITWLQWMRLFRGDAHPVVTSAQNKGLNSSGPYNMFRIVCWWPVLKPCRPAGWRVIGTLACNTISFNHAYGRMVARASPTSFHPWTVYQPRRSAKPPLPVIYFVNSNLYGWLWVPSGKMIWYSDLVWSGQLDNCGNCNFYLVDGWSWMHIINF